MVDLPSWRTVNLPHMPFGLILLKRWVTGVADITTHFFRLFNTFGFTVNIYKYCTIITYLYTYRISRKFDMELNLMVDNFLWSSPNLSCFLNNTKIILGSWAIVKFNLLNEFIFQIANIFSSQIFCLYGICFWVYTVERYTSLYLLSDMCLMPLSYCQKLILFVI